MKSFIFILFLLTSISLYSQEITVKVKNVQEFSHPVVYRTNDAVNENKIIYGNHGTTNTIYKFNIKDKVLYRKVDNDAWEKFSIISYNRVNLTHNIQILYPYNGGLLKLYITLSKVDDEHDIIQCRYQWDNEVYGWFDRTVKIKEG